jgi:hypothetical protein
MHDRLGNFEEFWPYYISQHHHPSNRALHVVGTAGVFLCLLGALREPLLLLACPVMGYGFAWVGHFFVEHNRPATFTYPLWSLRGDVRMFRLAILGRMRPEIERADRLFPPSA